MDFKWLIFWALLACFERGSGQPYISTVSRGYTTTETGDPFFECYRGSPDLDAAVHARRYVKTQNGAAHVANRDQLIGADFTAGNPPRRAYRVNLITDSHRSYGVFYCSACLGKECSVVPTIFLRSDAEFVPTNGRFSRTVNSGDVNVHVDFREITPTLGGKIWRFNGTDMGADHLSSGTPLLRTTVYTIPEVNTSDAGIYEIHLSGKRHLAKGGLLRLIVRECPANHYDASSGCTRICPSCYNGGICHDKTGRCICPPGFKGDNCEEACGGNRYGLDCEYRCDYDLDNKTACSGLQVCVPDPYGCSCTPGYKGLDCTTECDRGEFGASCTEVCQCASGKCDRFTGDCSDNSTISAPGCTGKNCLGDVSRTPMSVVATLSLIASFSVIVIAVIFYRRRKSCGRKPYDDTQSPETAPPAYQELCHNYERVISEGTSGYYLSPRSVTELQQS